MINKSESSEIAVLQTQMEEVKGQIADVKTAVDTITVDQHSNFNILSTKLDGIPFTLSALETRISALEKKGSKSWITNTLSAILGVILTGLVSLVVFLLIGKNNG